MREPKLNQASNVILAEGIRNHRPTHRKLEETRTQFSRMGHCADLGVNSLDAIKEESIKWADVFSLRAKT